MRRPAMLTSLLCLCSAVAAAAPARADSARSAGSFVDSIGVNVHMTYKDTAYADRDRLAEKLSEAGIRHVRDGLSYDTQYAYDTFNQLASRGIHTTFIMGDPTEQRDTLPELISTLRTKVRGAAEAVEGPNEYSHSGDPRWAERLRPYQRRLYAAVKSSPDLRGLPMLAPSLISPQDHAALGNLSDALDFGNKHSYPGGDIPEANLTEELSVAARVSGGRRSYVTESGYHNALNTDSGHRPVPESVAATYMSRMFLEYFRRGVARTFAYELIDEWPDPAKRELESDFGLLRSDYSEKPAFRSISNLIALLNDRAGVRKPRPLSYSVGGAPDDLRRLVLEKSDGSHYLVLWRAARVWDPDARRPLPVAPKAVTVSLPPGDGVIRAYSPVRSPKPYLAARTRSLRLTLKADPVVIRIQGSAAPHSRSAISVPSGQRLRSVLAKGLLVVCHLGSRGRCRVQARRRGRVVGVARKASKAGSARTYSVRLRPTRIGRRLLRQALHASHGPVRLSVRGRVGRKRLVTRRVALRR